MTVQSKNSAIIKREYWWVWEEAMWTIWQRRAKICTVIIHSNYRIMQNTLSGATKVHTQNNKAYKNTPVSTETHSVSSQRWWQETFERRRGTGSHLGHFCDRHSSLIHDSVWHFLKSEGQQRNWLRNMLKINQLNKHSNGKRSSTINHDCKPPNQEG